MGNSARESLDSKYYLLAIYGEVLGSQGDRFFLAGFPIVSGAVLNLFLHEVGAL